MECQLITMCDIQQRNSRLNDLIQLRINLVWNTKKKLGFLKNKLRRPGSKIIEPTESEVLQTTQLLPGDIVRVRAKDEIQSILDERGATNGCTFTPEMYARCGETYKILKEIHYFYDEVKNRMCKCRDMVILEGALCSGRRRMFSDDCDRCCFQFWHKRWLEKLEP
ncbi:MAG: hypothetical protein C4518_00390 [Desulfobacteraceae bacterium]|nr:MAG: hypothetical protein C4518_00390 [Desulfobacteraceae bacterium]